MNGNKGVEIIKQGNLQYINSKLFECGNCGCVWRAKEGFYEEDWTIHSIPAYCNCPCCGKKVYSISDLKERK